LDNINKINYPAPRAQGIGGCGMALKLK